MAPWYGMLKIEIFLRGIFTENIPNSTVAIRPRDNPWINRNSRSLTRKCNRLCR